MNDTVAAVVVTHNRWRLLLECLDALLNQSTPVSAIYVVDNASSDGTGHHLQEHGYLSNSAIHYLKLPANIGGAGGFYAGMERASLAGYSWIWLMDDDTEPRQNALEMMKPHMQLPEVVAIANTKLEPYGRPENHIAEVARRYRRSGYVRLSFSSFVGLLVRKTAVDTVGLPKKEFFIYGDDNEYCNRLAAIGDICLAKDAVVLHKAAGREKSKVRRFLWLKASSLCFDSFCFKYFYLRNLLWTCLHSRFHLSTRSSYNTVLAAYAKCLVKILFYDRDHRLMRSRILFRAFADGVGGNFDNTFAFECLAKAARNSNTSV
jgi:GT2 family glycosyltransferase